MYCKYYSSVLVCFHPYTSSVICFSLRELFISLVNAYERFAMIDYSGDLFIWYSNQTDIMYDIMYEWMFISR